jgi:hypothetical protein
MFDSSVHEVSKLGTVIEGALWGADCNTIAAATKLSENSECLRYIPVAVRKQFLLLVAQAAALKHGEW